MTLGFEGDDEGDYLLTFVLENNVIETDSGEYKLKDDGDDIEMNIGGDYFIFDLEIDGNDLMLSGNVDGEFWIIRAEK